MSTTGEWEITLCLTEEEIAAGRVSLSLDFGNGMHPQLDLSLLPISMRPSIPYLLRFYATPSGLLLDIWQLRETGEKHVKLEKEQ